jgi:hypothetical protein
MMNIDYNLESVGPRDPQKDPDIPDSPYPSPGEPSREPPDPYPVTDPPLEPDPGTEPIREPEPIPSFPEPMPGGGPPDVII